MPRVTCRCGEKLNVQPGGPDRIDCPKCGAKIRLRRSSVPSPGGEIGDGFLRFLCPCGRRLKVSAIDRPVAGKCPDCGRVVPVPTTVQASAMAVPAKQVAPADTEARTEELDSTDLAQLEEWSSRMQRMPITFNPQSPHPPVFSRLCLSLRLIPRSALCPPCRLLPPL